jgi:biofilm PGA synthesis N-glycosyltransferase PgaC
MLNQDALRLLASHFGDPQVAGVAGEKQVLGAGEGWYWRYESFLKRCESRIH